MKPHLFLAVATMLLVAPSCRRTPKPSVSADKTHVKVGEAIKFSNDTKHAASYEWDFGDGTRSTEAEPTKIFKRSGTFDVVLRAYSKKEKKSATDKVTIIVDEKLNEHFKGTHTIQGELSRVECDGNMMASSSTTGPYQLVIREGATDNEILIDNLGNIGLNNVRATVEKFELFFAAYYSFQVDGGQELTDQSGNKWLTDDAFITGDKFSDDDCISFDVNMSRLVTCNGQSANASLQFTSEDCQN